MKPLFTFKANKMKAILHVSFVVLTVLIVSCSGEQSEDNTVKISLDLSRAEALRGADVFESLEYIPLDSRQDSFLFAGSYPPQSKYHFDGAYFYIFEKNPSEAIYIFDRKGIFISRIANIENGPAAMSNVRDFWVNPEHSVEVLDGIRKKIFRYDVKGKLLDIFPTTYPFDQMVKLSNGEKYLFYIPPDKAFEQPKEQLFHIGDSPTDITTSLESVEISGNFFSRIQYNFSNVVDDHVLFHHFLSNKIYQISESELEAKYSIECDSWADETFITTYRRTPVNEQIRVLNAEDAKIGGVFFLQELEHHLFFCFFHQRRFYLAFFNKNTEETKLYYTKFNDYTANNIDQGLIPYMPLASYDGKYLVFSHAPQRVVKHANRMQGQLNKDNTFLQLSQDLRETDNRVLVLAKLKLDRR